MGPETSLPYISLHGFTSVRRRDCDNPTRHLHGEQEKEWTAARCHRLLRALTSRVAILNSDLARLSLARPNRNVQNQNTGRHGQPRRKRRRERDDDLDWAQSRKRIKQTYTTRSKRRGCSQSAPRTPRTSSSSAGMKSLAPGELSVPTPILARARGGPDIGDPPSTILNFGLNGHDARGNDEPQFQTSRSMYEIRQTTPASRYTIYEGIYNGLEALMRSTSNEEPQKVRKGARSLFSTCLRAVPQHISQEEATLLAHVEETGTKCAINTRDISTEIYDDLEDFGSSGHGWKPLKYVVRAHGVQVLSEAIGEGLLDIDFCGTLVALCNRTSAVDEADILLSSLLLSNEFQRPKTLYEPTPRPVSMLWRYVEDTGRFSFQYRQLANLISTGVLPLEWLATKAFRPVWAGVVQRLSPGSMNSEALDFLETTLPLLARAGPTNSNAEKASAEAMSQTFSSLLITLVSIMILSTGDSSTGLGSSNSDYGHIVTLLRISSLQYSLSDPSSDESVLLHIANLIVGAQCGANAYFDRPLPKALLSCRWKDRYGSVEVSTDYNDLVSFICSVARCCGRGASNSGFEQLEHLHQVLQQFASDEAGAGLIECVIVDSALSFAQQLPERKHLEYASALDTGFSDRNLKTHMNPAACLSDDARAGFRWEEGIGEWVTETPVKYHRRRQSPTSRDITDLASPSTPNQVRCKESGAKAWLKSTSNRYSSHQFYTPTSNAIVLVDSVAIEGSMRVQSDMSESDDERQITDFESGNASDSDSSTSVSRASFYLESPSSRRSSCLEDDDYESRNGTASPSPSSASYELQDDHEVPQIINRGPGHERRALRSSQAWQVLDESDDELSFLCVSTHDKRVFQDITNTPGTRTQSVYKTRKGKPKLHGISVGTITDSEDELCI